MYVFEAQYQNIYKEEYIPCAQFVMHLYIPGFTTYSSTEVQSAHINTFIFSQHRVNLPSSRDMSAREYSTSVHSRRELTRSIYAYRKNFMYMHAQSVIIVFITLQNQSVPSQMTIVCSCILTWSVYTCAKRWMLNRQGLDLSAAEYPHLVCADNLVFIRAFVHTCKCTTSHPRWHTFFLSVIKKIISSVNVQMYMYVSWPSCVYMVCASCA